MVPLLWGAVPAELLAKEDPMGSMLEEVVAKTPGYRPIKGKSVPIRYGRQSLIRHCTRCEQTNKQHIVSNFGLLLIFGELEK